MRSVSDVATDLARAHQKADPDIQQIWMIEDPAGTEVRLLEVSGSVGNVGAVMPYRFTARPPAVPYPSVLILLSPEEKDQLDRKELDLPSIWGSSPKLVRLV